MPIGRDEAGHPVELDLKEPASGGMGPHGIMVGATGSGKSELLRSITAALAARHEPSLLNLLLIDFKGGAAFAGLEPLPHVAGLVTNLAEEPGLISRVKAALAGELERRQRLLRDGGDLSSIGEYHARLSRLGKAGRAGQDELDPFPYLVVIVDEFGELLESEPTFIEVFNAIGRMGRSLGVHLLLATQRLDEGRIRALEPHLRYRLALRTFSAAESRNILGSPAAFELPPVPGMGYLAVDDSLTRFKGAIATLVNRPVSQQRGPLATNALRPLTLHSRDESRDDGRERSRDDSRERSRVGSRTQSREVGRDGLDGPKAATSTAPVSPTSVSQAPVSQAPVSQAPVQRRGTRGNPDVRKAGVAGRGIASGSRDRTAGSRPGVGGPPRLPCSPDLAGATSGRPHFGHPGRLGGGASSTSLAPGARAGRLAACPEAGAAGLGSNRDGWEPRGGRRSPDG